MDMFSADLATFSLVTFILEALFLIGLVFIVGVVAIASIARETNERPSREIKLLGPGLPKLEKLSYALIAANGVLWVTTIGLSPDLAANILAPQENGAALATFSKTMLDAANCWALGSLFALMSSMGLVGTAFSYHFGDSEPLSKSERISAITSLMFFAASFVVSLNALIIGGCAVFDSFRAAAQFMPIK